MEFKFSGCLGSPPPKTNSGNIHNLKEEGLYPLESLNDNCDRLWTLNKDKDNVGVVHT